MEELFPSTIIKCFISHWTSFLNNIVLLPTPTLYQHLTANIFKLLIQQHYKISSNHNADDAHDITQHEGNALRYAAGYVCRQFKKKIERGRHPLKEELILCLMSLTKGGQFTEANGTDEEWLNAIDRGGLWHIRENTYSLFCALEVQIQTQLKSLSRIRVTSSRKSTMIKEVVQSDDIQFYWIICKADFNNIHSKKCGVHSTPSSCHTIGCVSHQRNFGVLCTPSCGVTGFWCA